MTDEELIRWTAQAKIGDRLPDGIQIWQIYDRLAANGAPLERGMAYRLLAPIATTWARDWVEQHPE